MHEKLRWKAPLTPALARVRSALWWLTVCFVRLTVYSSWFTCEYIIICSSETGYPLSVNVFIIKVQLCSNTRFSAYISYILSQNDITLNPNVLNCDPPNQKVIKYVCFCHFHWVCNLSCWQHFNLCSDPCLGAFILHVVVEHFQLALIVWAKS